LGVEAAPSARHRPLASFLVSATISRQRPYKRSAYPRHKRGTGAGLVVHSRATRDLLWQLHPGPSGLSQGSRGSERNRPAGGLSLLRSERENQRFDRAVSVEQRGVRPAAYAIHEMQQLDFVGIAAGHQDGPRRLRTGGDGEAILGRPAREDGLELEG